MREFIRHPADIPIEFRQINTPHEQRETLSNISQGGLAFHTKEALVVGTQIMIRIPLRQPAYEARARVAWCQALDGKFEVGVELLDPGDGFRSRMVEQICHIEHYKQEVLRTEGRQLSGQEAAMEWIGKFASTFSQDDTPDHTPTTDPEYRAH